MLCLSNIITQIAVARMMCPKIILTHAQFRKKDECDTKLCDMIQAFDEQLPERDNDIIKIFLLLSAQI